MGAVALKTCIAVSQLLRSRRKELGLTLRDVSERLEERGERFPASTLIRVEQGVLDPGVRRLHMLLDLYEIPPHLIADLIQLEELAVEEPRGKDLDTLYREGVAFLKQGNMAQALAHLFAIRQYVPEDEKSRVLRQRATLVFAQAARDLGKFRVARQLVEDLLSESPDRSIIVNALILESTLWRARGSADMALAVVQRASALTGNDDPAQRAWIRHQEAKLQVEFGELEAAQAAVAEALKLYRRIGDANGEAKARLVQMQVEEARGETSRALRTARKAVETAERAGHELPLASARLELGRLLVAGGSVEEGLEVLGQALAQAVSLENKFVEFHAHYQLWKAYGANGQSDRSRFELHAASYFLGFIDSTSPEARDVREHAGALQKQPARRRRRRKPRARS
jgi:tetratricopeptide (TPR) repeat protein